MSREPVIAIIDIGKTNKKLFLFNQAYQIVYESSARLLETSDEDGFPCEDLEALRNFVLESIQTVLLNDEFDLKAVNFSAYGASFVYIDQSGNPIAPLYNYLKPFPEAIKKRFYKKYGGEEQFSLETASPVLGSLNSGLQLFRFKEERQHSFNQIQFALHLPQYLSYLLSGEASTDITSIGCHTALWNFETNSYHNWVTEENLRNKFAPLLDCEKALDPVFAKPYKIGIGLHDSSAALIPYLVCFNEPFVLISTGTWCISLNPFNKDPLTIDELRMDCLCYLQYKREPVKASRLFAGNQHEEQVKRIAQHFNKEFDFYKDIEYDSVATQSLLAFDLDSLKNKIDIIFKSIFATRDLSNYNSEKEAYHQLIQDIVTQQKFSTSLIISNNVKQIFVDGGFSKNSVYMKMLANAFPGLEIFSASLAQATALGSALAIHDEWNNLPIASNLVELIEY